MTIDLSSIPVIDQHAHNLVSAEVMAETPFTAAFTEGYAPDIRDRHARTTLCYRRGIKDIAALLDCEPTEAAVLSRRAELGLEELTRRCFAAANLQAIVMDDGFLPDTILPIDWHQTFAPTHPLLRIEWLAEQMIPDVTRFDVFLEWFRSELDPLPEGVVGFKSIAAYRTGLDIHPPSLDEAADCFYFILDNYRGDPIRLAHKPLIDFLVYETLEIAARNGTPIQFHTGFGDPDLDLRLANPLHLRPILEDARFANVPIVLLHAAYPFMREAGFLAAVYPQAYVDFGLAIPFLSVAGMRSTLSQLLELSPTSKVMYSSDAHLIPELYYLGALWSRRLLAETLERSHHDGEITATEVDEIAIAILHRNAQQLYRLNR